MYFEMARWCTKTAVDDMVKHWWLKIEYKCTEEVDGSTKMNNVFTAIVAQSFLTNLHLFWLAKTCKCSKITDDWSLFATLDNCGAIDVKMDSYVFEEKSSLKMPRLPLSAKLHWRLLHCLYRSKCHQEIEALICSIKSLSSEAALHLYKSIKWS